MRNILPALLSALFALSAVPALAAVSKGAPPKCSGRVVWVMPSQKAYVLSNNPLYGNKPGSYACESKALARGYHMRPLNIMRPRKMHATPRPNPTASAATPGAAAENPALTTLARAQIDIMRSGRIDRSQYGANLNAALTDKIVKQWSQLLAVSGAVTAFTYAGTTPYSGLPVAQYAISFEHPISVPNMPTTNQWIESIATDPAGKVIFLSFAPKT